MKLTMIYHDLYIYILDGVNQISRVTARRFIAIWRSRGFVFFGSTRLKIWFSNDTIQRLDEQETGRTLNCMKCIEMWNCASTKGQKVRVMLMSADCLRISHDKTPAASCSQYAHINFLCTGTMLSAGLYNKALEARFCRVWLYYFVGELHQMPLVAKWWLYS
jgi:hypothetical protein